LLVITAGLGVVADDHPIPDSIGRMKCQVVRSMGEWHNGNPKTALVTYVL